MREDAEWASTFGLLPRPVDYLTYYGFYLNRQRCQALAGLAVLRALGASRGAVDPLLVDAATVNPHAVVGEVRRWEAQVAEAQATAARSRGPGG